MGVKILNEDGSLLHEFRDGLGLPLLYRVLAVAKFTGEDQPEIILNPHVTAVHCAIAEALEASSKRPHATPQGVDPDGAAKAARPRLAVAFRDAVLNGALRWPSWSDAEKRAFVTQDLFAPLTVSAQFVTDFIEEEDWRFQRIRNALSNPPA